MFNWSQKILQAIMTSHPVGPSRLLSCPRPVGVHQPSRRVEVVLLDVLD